MSDRRRKMNHLFACLSEAGIGDDQRHAWASDVLRYRTVDTFTSLTIAEIDTLIAAAQAINAAPEGLDYGDECDESVLCGEIGPDGQECVVDAAHYWRGEDHAGADGRAWVLQ